MKKKVSSVIVTLIILVGLAFLLYPTISDLLKTIAYNSAIDNFRTVVATIDNETYDDIMADAIAYNQKLLSRGNIRANLTDEELEEYESKLKIDESGIMGYVVIPKINVSLPIYHGTSDTVLQSGVGHLEGSSLPIGGKGSHAVLSGHRGLPSAKLFTNIDRLQVGDTFTVRVLREVLTYEVDDISTVLPSEVNALQIVENEDYCTLLTCTPYGVNSHRLLVRGHRIPTPPEEDAETFDNIVSDGIRTEYLLLIVGVAAVAILFGVITVTVRRHRKRRVSRIENHTITPLKEEPYE
ncbi:MAG: class C sortase [Christensenellaceae bacterium]|nr:class C sortase [Christensenellaceae bacterium]